MDYKIYNIELVNRLLAWQHTAFKTKTFLPVFRPGKERESASEAEQPPPDQRKIVAPLNVITQIAADVVLCHNICCFFVCLPSRCRSPPFAPEWFQNSDEVEEPLMWQRNNGQGENNILQNQFTAYLVTAVRRQKLAYLKKGARLGKYELPTDFDSAFAQTLEALEDCSVSLEQPVLDSVVLAQALTRISDRERHVFLARVLEERSFEDLAAELGVGYKGAAAVYYRAIQKLKKEL